MRASEQFEAGLCFATQKLNDRPMEPLRNELLGRFFADHQRSWQENLYVYPVVSRRSGGISIGVNLNPDKACNFDCVYCQVDRSVPPVVRTVELDRLREELELTLAAVVTGRLFDDSFFAGVPASHRRLNDIAFSGDGEPTTSPQFAPAVRIAADLKRRLGLTAVKTVLITDAAYLDRTAIREGLAVMDETNGEIWAKLDAGTEDYYRLINRPNVPLQKILDNILEVSRVRPIVIQSLWMHVRGEPPSPAEINAFAHRIKNILDAGGQIKLVQIYTIARRTTEPWVTPLSEAQLDAIAGCVREIAYTATAVFGS
jgi:wyosine [tRNA(Phe)-imidazoG37] synthetase (radical SAM superfamily)